MKKKGFLFGGIGLAVVAVVVLVVFLMRPAEKDPKEAVIAAFKSLVEQKTPESEWEAIAKSIEDSETSAIFTLIDSGSEELPLTNRASIEFNMQNEASENELRAKLGLSMMGLDFTLIDAYLDEAQILLQMPMLNPEILYLERGDDLPERLKASYLGSLMEEQGIKIDDSVSLQEKLEQKDELFDFEALWKRYQEGSEAVKTLKDAMVVVKSKEETRTMTINGVEEACQRYDVSIPKADFVDFLKKASHFFLEDEKFQEDMKVYLEMMKEMSADPDMAYVTDEYEQMVQQLLNGDLDVFLADLEKIMEDIQFTVFTNSKGQMAAFEGTFSLLKDETSDENFVMMDCKAEFNGGKYLMENAKFTLAFKSGEESVFNIGAEAVGLEEGSASKNCWTFVLQEYSTLDNEMKIVLGKSYDKESDALALDFLVTQNDMQMMFLSANGTLKLEEKLIALNLDDIVMEVEDEKISAAINYELKELEVSPVPITGTKFDILGASAEDWEALGEELGMYGY